MGGGGQPCPLPLCNAPCRHRTTPVQCRGNENKSLIGSVRLGILPLNGCHSLKWVWPGGLIKGGEGGGPIADILFWHCVCFDVQNNI